MGTDREVTSDTFTPTPSNVKTSSWEDVLRGSASRGAPGVSCKSFEVLEYRDADGILRGAVSWQNKTGRLFVIVDPSVRRSGIATLLMKEAVRRWDIDFSAQVYSENGAAFFRKFLAK
jgi:hypothetical protein